MTGDWVLQAKCRDDDPGLFHPEKGDGTSIAKAKRLCAHCPVREPCLEHAIAEGEVFGVWGGKTGRERERIINARRRERKFAP